MLPIGDRNWQLTPPHYNVRYSSFDYSQPIEIDVQQAIPFLSSFRFSLLCLSSLFPFSLSLSLSPYLFSVSLFIYLTFLSLYLCVSVFLCICTCLFPPLPQALYIAVCLQTLKPLSLCLCLYICLQTSLPFSLYLCLSLHALKASSQTDRQILPRIEPGIFFPPHTLPLSHSVSPSHKKNVTKSFIKWDTNSNTPLAESKALVTFSPFSSTKEP